MNTFRFRLQRVLDLRRKQFELEEAGYRQCLAELAKIDRTLAGVQASAHCTESEIRSGGVVTGQDLMALDRFRTRIQSEVMRIERSRAEMARRAGEQQQAMIEAQRRYRLLEKLRERRLAEWESERNRVLEEIAAESFLAGWVREWRG